MDLKSLYDSIWPWSEKVNKNTNPTTEEIYETIKSGDVEQVKLGLIKIKNESEDPDTLRNTLCHLSATGYTLLGVAVQHRDSELLMELIQNGSDVNQRDYFGQSALQYASAKGYEETMLCLIQQGADINWMGGLEDSRQGLCAIHVAAAAGQQAAVKMLLEHGAEFNMTNRTGVSPVYLSVQSGQHDVTRQLLKAGASPDKIEKSSSRSAVFMAVDEDDVDMVKLLVEYDCNTYIKDRHGFTPLCLACLHNKTDIIRVLVEGGADVNQRTRHNGIPLHFTAKNGDLDMTKLLLDEGSNMHTMNKHFETPLHEAVRMGHVSIIQEFVRRGCDVNLCDPFGNTAAIDSNNISALHLAVQTNYDPVYFERILCPLIEGNCDLDILAHISRTSFQTSTCDETPLTKALNNNKSAIAIVLLQHGASPNVDCPYEITVLQKACQRKLYDVVDTLLYTDLDWDRERWRFIYKHNCGYNRDLLEHHTDDVPLELHGRKDIFDSIQELLVNPWSLMRSSRRIVRRQLGHNLQHKLREIGLPKRLVDFVMLRIL